MLPVIGKYLKDLDSDFDVKWLLCSLAANPGIFAFQGR